MTNPLQARKLTEVSDKSTAPPTLTDKEATDRKRGETRASLEDHVGGATEGAADSSTDSRV